MGRRGVPRGLEVRAELYDAERRPVWPQPVAGRFGEDPSGFQDEARLHATVPTPPAFGSRWVPHVHNLLVTGG